MPTDTKKLSLKQLRDAVERAQLEAALRELETPQKHEIKGLEIKPRVRVFLYRTLYKESKETLTAMANDLAKSMGEERIAIINVTGDTDFKEI